MHLTTLLIPMDMGDLVRSFQNLGGAVLAIGVVIAILIGFLTKGRGRLLGVLSALAIGGLAYMVVGQPETMLKELGTVIKTALWDPFLESFR